MSRIRYSLVGGEWSDVWLLLAFIFRCGSNSTEVVPVPSGHLLVDAALILPGYQHHLVEWTLVQVEQNHLCLEAVTTDSRFLHWPSLKTRRCDWPCGLETCPEWVRVRDLEIWMTQNLRLTCRCCLWWRKLLSCRCLSSCLWLVDEGSGWSCDHRGLSQVKGQIFLMHFKQS